MYMCTFDSLCTKIAQKTVPVKKDFLESKLINIESFCSDSLGLNPAVLPSTFCNNEMNKFCAYCIESFIMMM